jgi:RimJ/RimL family protein N-acetyltransferase
MIEFSWPIALHAQEAFLDRATADETTRRLVIQTEQDGVIGYTGLWGINWIDRRATNGIIVGKAEARRKGYAQDAILTLLRVAFCELGLRRIDVDIFEFNDASLRLYTERCGFKVEGRRRGHIFRNGRYWDRILVGITAEEYQAHVDRLGYWMSRS